MSIDGKRRLAATGFIALLFLSVLWPSPVVSVNRLCCNAPLGIDELSFLGRESPAWDLAFWCVAGLFALLLLQDARDFSGVRQEFRGTRVKITMAVGVAVAGAAAIVAIIWLS